jgi:hypothetical protein
MGLDILTPKGRIAAQQQIDAVNAIVARSPGLSFAHTPTEGGGAGDRTAAACIDGVFIRNERIVACAEVKSRNMTVEQLEKFNHLWLVTRSKIEELKLISSLLCVVGVGILYLVPSRVVLMQTICRNGQWLVDFQVDETATQATCNGGEAVRDNAFISMSGAKVYPIPTN